MKDLINRDIVITGIQSWDIKIGSNCKNIATELAKKNRVLYVNPPTDRFTLLRNKQNTNKHPFIRVVNDKLWVLTPQVVIESISQLSLNLLFDALNWHNNKLFAKEISKGIKKLGFSNYIHFCDSDMFRSFYLKELLKPSAFVYYSRDNLRGVKYWQKQGTRLEPKIIAKSDVVVANSTYLTALASVDNTNSHFVGQGCDLPAFEEKEQSSPKELKGLCSPIIGYIGALDSNRLDIALIEKIANENPKWNIALVGPEDNNFSNSQLHKMPNVYFTGSKKQHELPEYLNAFDVAINPQVVNEITVGNYPRKIDEYLAMGKPTVATETKAMEYFAAHVSLAKNSAEWITKIDHEYRTNNEIKKRERKAFAGEHSWQNNVALIGKHILNHQRNLANKNANVLA